ncbi:hypothetical protein [Cupriavidus oxalaticus]|uniref:hypothetical protein n=1 Tax=Cupriavidus oxalaticus TaxID=96344 RepID=UPI00197A99D9|nr:hypothetical protein [Cupriavidus oxalaticus]
MISSFDTYYVVIFDEERTARQQNERTAGALRGELVAARNEARDGGAGAKRGPGSKPRPPRSPIGSPAPSWWRRAAAQGQRPGPAKKQAQTGQQDKKQGAPTTTLNPDDGNDGNDCNDSQE